MTSIKIASGRGGTVLEKGSSRMRATETAEAYTRNRVPSWSWWLPVGFASLSGLWLIAYELRWLRRLSSVLHFGDDAHLAVFVWALGLVACTLLQRTVAGEPLVPVEPHTPAVENATEKHVRTIATIPALARINCWEFTKCGFEPGGANVARLGVCVASTHASADGIHGGKNAGRSCWAVAGTLCGGKVQGTHAEKNETCVACDHYRETQRQEGASFLPLERILAALKTNSARAAVQS